MTCTRSTDARTGPVTLLATVSALALLLLSPASALAEDHEDHEDHADMSDIDHDMSDMDIDPEDINEVDRPDSFTSAFSVSNDPDQVIEPGEPGASATFDLLLDADNDIICFDIESRDVTPPYESPADTSTHIHEGPPGEEGPPRVVFPDPDSTGGTLTSSGCMQGPFTTGVEDDDGADEGDGFTLSEIEADPQAFYTDIHTEDFPTGAVRGQLSDPLPPTEVDAGAGATAETSSLWLSGALAAAVLLALLGGIAWRWRTQRGG